MNTTAPAPTKNERLLAWVEEVAALTEPDADPLVRRLGRGVRPRSCQQLVDAGTFERLVGRQAPELLPRRCPIRATSRASRTARSSARPTEAEAGPTNNWREPGRDARTR